MRLMFTNNPEAQLASAVLASDGTLALATGSGARFPALSAGQSFAVTVQDMDGMEIMLCTARSDDTLTVSRGQEGTSARAFAEDAIVQARITAHVLETMIQRAGDTMQGALLLPDGTATEPALAFASDTDTGLYRLAADSFGIATAGTLRMQVGPTGISYFYGDVGISKSQPGFYLDKSPGFTASLYGRAGGVARWGLALGHAAAESGSNVGSDFVLSRFSDAGAHLGDPLNIKRSSGLATFTGDVSIAKAGPQLILDKSAAAQNVLIRSRRNGSERWAINLASSGAEPGGDASSDFSISRYSDAGVELGSPLLINRATGIVALGDVVMGGTLHLFVDPVEDLEAATKQYVDVQDEQRVAISGDTMTGALWLPPGTFTAPSLRFVDSTSGFYQPGGDNISVVTDGVERINIGDTGIVTFSSIPMLPDTDPTNDDEAARKAYVDANAWREAPVDDTPYVRLNAAWTPLDQTAAGMVHGEWNYGAMDIVPPPQSGRFRMNSLTLSAVTALYIHYTTANAVSVERILLTVMQQNMKFYIQNRADPTQWALFRLTGDPIDGVTYAEVPVVYEDGGTIFSNLAKCYFFGLDESPTDLDARFVNITGDTMSGALHLPSAVADGVAADVDLVLNGKGEGGIKLAEQNHNYWRVIGGAPSGQIEMLAEGDDTNILMGFRTKGTGSIRFFTGGSTSEQLRIVNANSSVNFVQVQGGATGQGVLVAASGGDTNVQLQLQARGSSAVVLRSNSAVVFVATGVTSGVNNITATNAVASSAPFLAATGSDTNIDLSLRGKGTGAVILRSNAVNVLTASGTVVDVPVDLRLATTSKLINLRGTINMGNGGTATANAEVGRAVADFDYVIPAGTYTYAAACATAPTGAVTYTLYKDDGTTQTSVGTAAWTAGSKTVTVTIGSDSTITKNLHAVIAKAPGTADSTHADFVNPVPYRRS